MVAVSRIWGDILETEGPGLSARMRKMVCPPASGSTISMNTSTPIPPTQCVRQRHSMEAWDSASTSLRMVAPVVVKPETVSKSASTKNGISPLSTNGSAPITARMSQQSATVT